MGKACDLNWARFFPGIQIFWKRMRSPPTVTNVTWEWETGPPGSQLPHQKQTSATEVSPTETSKAKRWKETKKIWVQIWAPGSSHAWSHNSKSTKHTNQYTSFCHKLCVIATKSLTKIGGVNNEHCSIQVLPVASHILFFYIVVTILTKCVTLLAL